MIFSQMKYTIEYFFQKQERIVNEIYIADALYCKRTFRVMIAVEVL